jgi:2-oxoglutarate dehydrogenase E1 component
MDTDTAPERPGPSQPDLAVNGWNAEYLLSLHEQWTADPDSISDEWQQFFRGFDLATQLAPADDLESTPVAAAPTHIAHSRQGRADSLIYHYRDIGHLAAELDPLGVPRPFPEQLKLDTFGLSPEDLSKEIDPGTLPLADPSTIRDVMGVLERTYTRHIGVEYMHIQDRTQRRWLQHRMETVQNRPSFTPDRQKWILQNLLEATTLERFLHLRYVGDKWFSLEGSESLIPMLRTLIDDAAAAKIEELAIGMAHRGRINVLVNVLGKTYEQIFTEFNEAWIEDFIEGGHDVKHHLGHSTKLTTDEGQEIYLAMSSNPSHLEFGHSVVLGRARARQRIHGDSDRLACVPVLIHGDAAFPGQGIVAEMFNMAHLDGYSVGGSIHIVVNNQIGFTTEAHDAHSGTYCTDLAKIVSAPIFHVNGDDPEACCWVAQLAMAYRQAFRNDVVIDMWCYRKYGHNESDEPRFTQPKMYELIANQTPTVDLYAQQLTRDGVITQDDLETMRSGLSADLDASQSKIRTSPVAPTLAAFQPHSKWDGLTSEYDFSPGRTAVDRATLEQISTALATVPEGFNLNRKLIRIMGVRGTAVAQDRPLDWAMGELLAYGSMLLDGHPIRLTGQDVCRGTFSHRHALVYDQVTGEPYKPLAHLSPDQASMCIHNSPLTEAACVGFEYGYSTTDPDMLVIWEAQFGDFANGAQVIFDQFITAAETKWRRSSGLTLFLPHGYEGMGAEHSSARLERFLSLAANDNIQVIYPTTPAQCFHMLRQQVSRNFRKPLVVMTPKSLLRNPAAVSSVKAFTDGHFHHVIDDPATPDPSQVTRIALCSGKIYHDLAVWKTPEERRTTAIIRLEQLYPFPEDDLRRVLEPYGDAQWCWVQEEPRNMGGFLFVADRIRTGLGRDVTYIGRSENATPAVASKKIHKQEQEAILRETLGEPSAKEPSAKEPSAS